MFVSDTSESRGTLSSRFIRVKSPAIVTHNILSKGICLRLCDIKQKDWVGSKAGRIVTPMMQSVADVEPGPL